MCQVSLRVLSVLALVVSPVAAQRTWIVDQFGTGHFRDVPAAVAAAAPGDSILVWGIGPYDLSVTIDKPLSLMGQVYSRYARGTLVIANLAAGQTVTVKNFGHFAGDALRCVVRDCAGHVVLQELTLDGHDGASATAGLTVMRSGAVAVRDLFVRGNPAGVVHASNLVGSGDFAAHADGLAGGAPLHGLDIVGSSAALSVSSVGGDGSPGRPRGGDGLRAVGSRLRLSGCSVTAGSSHGGAAPYSLFAGTSDVELNDDPALLNRFSGAVETATSTVRRRAFPIIATDGWTPHPPLLGIVVEGLPNSMAAIFGGIPTTPYLIPEGDLWLLAAPLVVIHVGPIPAWGSLRIALPLPINLPWGLTFGLQAAEVTPNGFALSPPVFPIFEPGNA